MSWNPLSALVSKIGAGILQAILILALAADYFNVISINEPYHKGVIVWLAFNAVVSLCLFGNKKPPVEINLGSCPKCGKGFTITGFECKNCKYEIPKMLEDKKDISH